MAGAHACLTLAVVFVFVFDMPLPSGPQHSSRFDSPMHHSSANWRMPHTVSVTKSSCLTDQQNVLANKIHRASLLSAIVDVFILPPWRVTTSSIMYDDMIRSLGRAFTTKTVFSFKCAIDTSGDNEANNIDANIDALTEANEVMGLHEMDVYRACEARRRA